jgi:hypothetical protein
MSDKKITEEMTSDEELLAPLRHDICPDCGAKPLRAGPRGGVGQNIFCDGCGAGFNVVYPRYIVMAQRIK